MQQRHSRKKDIKFIYYIQSKYNLSDKEREILHEMITGQNLSDEEIEECAQDIVQGRGGSRGGS